MTDDIWQRDEVQSPCVKICVVHPEARLCTGCLRSIDEITQWSRMSPDERRAIVDAMWRVVLADGIEQDQEVELVHLIEEQLGVEAQHSAEARALAESIR